MTSSFPPGSYLSCSTDTSEKTPPRFFDEQNSEDDLKVEQAAWQQLINAIDLRQSRGSQPLEEGSQQSVDPLLDGKVSEIQQKHFTPPSSPKTLSFCAEVAGVEGGKLKEVFIEIICCDDAPSTSEKGSNQQDTVFNGKTSLRCMSPEEKADRRREQKRVWAARNYALIQKSAEAMDARREAKKVRRRKKQLEKQLEKQLAKQSSTKKPRRPGLTKEKFLDQFESTLERFKKKKVEGQ